MVRSEQKTEDTWRLEDLYETKEAYAADAARLKEQMDAFEKMEGSLGQGAGALLAALQAYEAMSRRFDRLYVFAQQSYHEDTAEAVRQKRAGESQILLTRISQVSAWLSPELLSLDPAYLKECLADERLAEYRLFAAQRTRLRGHTLDAKTESLLARAGDLAQAPDTIFSMFNNADVRFPDAVDQEGKAHPVTNGGYISLVSAQDRTLRKNAFESLYSVYGQFIHTLAAAYYGNAKQADFFAKEHGYASALEQALDANDVPVSVYMSLIDAVDEALPLMHRYFTLRKRLLGLDELHMYDVYTPVTSAPERKYSFKEAKEIVLKGLAPLGEKYLSLLKEGFSNRWIDIYENEGKRTGAYSWGAYGTHPYVLLNYHGMLEDVFTLAHEMGHALHTWHSNQTQPYLYSGYRIFVAEVASICNEALLIRYLLSQTEDAEEKKYLVNYFLNQFKGTMFRQTMFAEFERDTHAVVANGGVLTADDICASYLELNRRYFGPDMIVDAPIQYEWAKIPHFYTPFYVYQYATSFAAAIAVSSKILSGEPGILEKYFRFLSSGCSQDPISLLKICGVDMTSPEPVAQALKVFEEYLGKFEELTAADRAKTQG